jgi:hypothetical protein
VLYVAIALLPDIRTFIHREFTEFSPGYIGVRIFPKKDSIPVFGNK